MAPRYALPMPLDVGTMLLAAEDRLAQARGIADSCESRGELHKVLMRSVFLMEDIVFMLHEMAALDHESRHQRACHWPTTASDIA